MVAVFPDSQFVEQENKLFNENELFIYLLSVLIPKGRTL
jgi:hypothetical protein